MGRIISDTGNVKHSIKERLMTATLGWLVRKDLVERPVSGLEQYSCAISKHMWGR